MPPQSPLKIMYFAHAAVIGGTLRQMAFLCTHLNRERFNPIVICATASALDAYAAELEQHDIPVIRLTVSGKRDLTNLRRLIQIFRQQQPDILHVQLSEPFDSTPVFLMAKLAGVPVILASERLMYNHARVNKRWYSPYIKTWQTRWLIDMTIAVSQAVRTCLLQALPIAPQRVVVIHNALALPPSFVSSAATRSDLNVIGFVGQVIRAKGIFLFIEAAAQLAERSPALRFVVIGEGADRKQAQQDAARYHLDHRIVFSGYQRDVVACLQQMDILVAPSSSESFGNSLVEAMALGVPVITTAVGIAPEIIQHRRTGLLIPPDNVDAIVEAVTFLRDHPDDARCFAERGRTVVCTQFHPDRIIAQFEELYHHTFQQKSRHL